MALEIKWNGFWDEHMSKTVEVVFLWRRESCYKLSTKISVDGTKFALIFLSFLEKFHSFITLIFLNGGC